MFSAFPGLRAVVASMLDVDSTVLETNALGLKFSNPIGLAAGFDKDAVAYEMLGALGFGFVEIGTLTGERQSGNDRPRLFRLPRDRALVNRMGFNNLGSANAVERLQGIRHTTLGVNIGKTKVVPESEAVADYVKSAGLLAALADYFVVNVSSPNTPGLRDLQAVEKLRPLVVAIRAELDRASPERRVPLLVKIAPDLSNEDIDALADMALELKLDGLIAANTTIGRESLSSSQNEIEGCGAGGLSGAPLHDRSLEVLKRLRRKVGNQILLVSVGGIETAEQAWARIKAGATLVQIYTAFIYHGPILMNRMAKGLVKLAEAEGFGRVQDAVGADIAE